MENFDIAKYLRENHLGSHAILGNYVDLHALKEVEDMEGLEIVKGFGALKDKSVADKYAEVCKQAGMKGVKVIEKDGVFKIYANAGQKLNKEADYGNNEPVDQVPYVGAEKKLDGFGDKFDQVDPVEEANGPFGMPDRNEDNPWMSDVDGTDAYKVGDWTCYYDYPGVLIWSYGDKSFDELAVYATPNYNGDDTTPIQIDVDGENEDMMAIDKGIFADFNEYARDMKPYLDMVERMLSNQESPVAKGMNDDDSENPFPSIMKEKKDSVIFDKGWQYDDDDVDAEDDMDPDTRFADLGGDQIKTAIKSLMDDGFDSREIAQFVVDTIRGFKSFKEEVPVSSSGVGMEEALSYEDLENDLNKIAIKMRKVATLTHNNAGDFTFVNITADDDDDPAYNKKVQNAGYKEVVDLIKKKYPTLKVIEKEQNFDKVSFVIARK